LDTGNPDLGCLFFGNKSKTWVQAHEECEGYIGHMAEATTLAQANEIYTLAKIIGDIRGVKRWWLGLTDIIKEGDWHWANSYESGSVQVSDFATIWTPNAKADNLDDCVLMKDDNGKLSWADIHCDNTTTTEADGSPLEIEVLCQCVGEECTPPTPEPTLQPTTTAPTCDAGWIVNQGLGCIKPLAEGADTTTLAKAAGECAKVLGGTSDGVLVEPQDACKEAALIDFLKYPLSKDVWWIGLTYDTSSTKKWKWTSTATYDETQADWGPGAGQFPELLDCAGIEERDGVKQWYNRPCSSALTDPLKGGAICVKDPAYKCVATEGSSSTSSTAEGGTTATTTPTPGTGTTTEPRGCQHNPSEANGPCYLVKDEAKSFQEAESYCTSLGGHLVSSLSASENLYIGSLIHTGTYWWIGAQCGDGTACTSNDSWAWTDGSTWVYENWVTGDSGSKPCAIYERSSRNWRSWSCSSTFPFVCKI